MKTLCDFHTHILPGLDDGAADIEQSLQLLHMQEKQHVGHVLLTPHFYAESNSIENFVACRDNAFATLRENYNGTIALYRGAEVFIDPTMRTVRGLSNLCIENTDYILIEFPFVEKEIGWILEMVEILLYDHRLRPIIAHGERYLWLMKQPQLLYEMIQAGCLVQCNISSLLNGQNKYAKKLLEHNMVHLLGSDCHHPEKRPPQMGMAMQAGISEETLSAFSQNALAVLQNQRPALAELKPLKKQFFHYYL